jgi:hypothetical protein
LGRLYRRLGGIHQAGFRVANGSPLQYLYFDALGPSFFLQHAKAGALERSATRLDRVLKEIANDGLAEADHDFNGLARQEIAWAADATRLAVEKGLAALDYNGWREDPAGLGVTARRRLARRFDDLANEQADQLQRFEALWLARSEISELAKIRKRIRRSIHSLRDASRRLRKNAPSRPAKASELSMLGVYNEIRREMGMPPR